MASSLSPEQPEHIRHLFEELVEIDAEARAERLDQIGQDDPGLREEVEALLQAYAHVDDVLATYEHVLPGPEAEARQEAVETDPHGLVGQRVAHYLIQEKLGGGGMGVVYKAHDTKLDRSVALKFLPPHLSLNDEAKARFTHEAKAASALDHVNICTIHDIGQTDDGRLFIAMAYYAGETLKAKIARGPLPLDEALDYVEQVAQGLERAHEAGIVHRDVKPLMTKKM